MRVERDFCFCDVPFMMEILVCMPIASRGPSLFMQQLPQDHVIDADGDIVENFQLASPRYKDVH
jgi:hypothetical protein